MKQYATSREILDLLGQGVLITIALTSPYAGAELIKHLAFKVLDKAWEKYDQARLKQSIKRMIKSQFLDVKEENGKTTLVVTLKGKRKLLQYNLQSMKLEFNGQWDGKWRIVIFDVVEGKRCFRDGLRKKIKQLGLFQMQKSVFVTPYPCENEIAFLREYLEIKEGVSCFTTTDLEEEEFLKKRFGLG
jgi:phenylacetic acid degradation operon negative regulatory protein